MYIDTHCHVFSEYYDDIEKVISECKDNNVNRIIVNGCDIVSNKEVLELVNKYDIIYGAIGFHPTELDDFNDEYFSFLEENINNSKIVAVGEIGLDYHYGKEDKILQLDLFAKQLKIAEKLNLPVVIHSRDATEDTINMLKKFKVKGVIHCFSGSLETAKTYIKMGYYLGIGGVVTFKNSKLGTTLQSLSLDNIVLETDSPYLSPVPYRGKVNSSKNIPIIARFLGNELNQDIDIIEKITTENAKLLFTKLK